MITKSILSGFFGLICSFQGLTQTNAPQIEWQLVHGGTSSDEATVILKAKEGNYYVAGNSLSGISGNKTSPNFGGNDLWLLKVDEYGSKLWDRSFGGDANEFVFGLAETVNGDCLLLGTSQSGATGNKTASNLGTNSNYDAWLVRVDSNGNKLWDRSYGGSGDDWGWGKIVLTQDNGLVFVVHSASPADGNKTATNLGMTDYWVVKLDSDGNMIWDKTFGGDKSEVAPSLIQLRDGGFLVGGSSDSEPSGNKSSPHYGPLDAGLATDYWVVRLDKDGNKLWDQTFGGSGFDYLSGLLQDKDGNLLLIGFSSSPADGNKTSPYYDPGQSNAILTDYWIVKLDEQGNKLWDRSFGGTFLDRPLHCIQTEDGNFLVCGYSDSLINGTKTTPRFGANSDGWLVRFDGAGNQLWDLSLGGDYGEILWSVVQTEDGGYLAAASSYSQVNGNKTVPNFGQIGSDVWLLKLRPDTVYLRPVSQPADGIETTGFQIRLSAPTNTYVLDYSTDLSAWQSFHTNVLMSNSVVIADAEATNSSRRFYRARVANP